MKLSVYLTLTVLATWPALSSEPRVKNDPAGVLERYLAWSESHRTQHRAGSVEIDIEASLPSLNKSGRMHALKHKVGPEKVTFEVLSFTGDRVIKTEVIARYLTAELKSQESGKRRSLSINEENYTFVHRATHGSGDWRLHLFELRPRETRVGLYHGWLWVEAETGLPVRESGRFVKNPSVFVKRVEFLRDYELRDGEAVPVRIESAIDTRLVGTAQLSVSFAESTRHPKRGQLASCEESTTPSSMSGT